MPRQHTLLAPQGFACSMSRERSVYWRHPWPSPFSRVETHHHRADLQMPEQSRSLSRPGMIRYSVGECANSLLMNSLLGFADGRERIRRWQRRLHALPSGPQSPPSAPTSRPSTRPTVCRPMSRTTSSSDDGTLCVIRMVVQTALLGGDKKSLNRSPTPWWSKTPASATTASAVRIQSLHRRYAARRVPGAVRHRRP